MKDLFDSYSAVQAIVDANQSLSLTTAPLTIDIAKKESSVFRIAYLAACTLGFVDTDARCIANAWALQCERTGRFDPCAWPSDPADFGIATWPRSNGFAACPKALGLYAVMPNAQWVTRMAHAGVGTVQLRFKSDRQVDIEREIGAAIRGVEGTPSLLFINDHWQAAIRAGAYGVHLGQEDLDGADVADVTAIREAELRLGISTHGYAEMLRADKFSPSYIAMGAVFPTNLKQMQTAPQGIGRLRQYAKLLSDYPLVAIGGIDQTNFKSVVACEVGSIGVVRALIEANHPESVAKQLSCAF